MTDMSTHPSGAGNVTQPVDERVAASFMRGLEHIAGALSDNLNHPEIWEMLKTVVEQDDVSALLHVLRDIRPNQYNSSVIKTLDIVCGVIVGLSIDKTTGLEMLAELELRYMRCPQVAGAYAFVERA